MAWYVKNDHIMCCSFLESYKYLEKSVIWSAKLFEFYKLFLFEESSFFQSHVHMFMCECLSLFEKLTAEK